MCTAPNCVPHYSLWLIEMYLCVRVCARARTFVSLNTLRMMLRMIKIFSIRTKNSHRSCSKIVVGFFLALVRFCILLYLASGVCVCVCFCACGVCGLCLYDTTIICYSKIIFYLAYPMPYIIISKSKV